DDELRLPLERLDDGRVEPLADRRRVGADVVLRVDRARHAVVERQVGDLRELYRMRELLEEEAIRAALPRIDGPTLERLARHVGDADDASAAGDLAAYAQSNRRFHLELYEASGRPLLARTIRQLWDASDAYRALYANRDSHRATAAEHHRAILDALASGDADAAVAAQDRHRAHALAALTAILPD
ncbi:MAG TPA: FCD domain-containing protein, partial [Thermoleophilaceae bacterium]|nr:FCD domain-containing protein [Thermoleophilaceae bacterium]